MIQSEWVAISDRAAGKNFSEEMASGLKDDKKDPTL